MEVTSTPDMVSVITDINGRERDIIEEDLAEVDKELDMMETQFNEELEQVDKEMDEMSDATYSDNTDQTSRSDENTKSNMRACRDLLHLRWEKMEESKVKDAIKEFTGEEGDEFHEQLMEWLATREDENILDEAMEKIEECENMMLNESDKLVLSGFVRVVTELAVRWQDDLDRVGQSKTTFLKAGKDVSQENAYDDLEWTDVWQEIKSPVLVEKGGEYSNMMNMDRVRTRTTQDDLQEGWTGDDGPRLSTRAEKMRQVRERRRLAADRRKEKMFQPVETNIEIEKVRRRATTMRGEKYIQAGEVNNSLVQERYKKQVGVGSDVEALYFIP